MAQGSNNNAVLIAIMVSAVAFGAGYLVGNANMKTSGDAPAEVAGAIGGAAAPTFGGKGAEGASGRGTAGLDSGKLPVGNSYVLGNPDALVTIIEFSDFQCPYCKRGADTIKQLVKKYPKDVRVVFKHYPLPFHKEAPAASRAALAAGEQGKFWEMHDLLFQNFGQFKANKDDMKGYTAGFAKQLGLDVDKFKKDFDNPEYQKAIDADMKLGSTVGVRGTPHFFVNGERISGAQKLPTFEASVKARLAEAQEMIKKGTPASKVYAAAVKKNYKAAADKKPPAPPSKVSFIPVNDVDMMKGNTTDPLVTIVEFSEYQCPYCTKGAAVVEEIMKNHSKDVRFVFKNLPLNFHPQAKPAAIAALAAGKQGKYWEMHDALFARQKELKTNPQLFSQLAQQLGLNMAKCEKDQKDPKLAAQVDADAALASKVGARGTPNFFVNGVQIVGARPYDSFKAEIEKQVKIAQKIKKEKGLKGDALYKAVVDHNVKNAPKAPAAKPQPAAKVDPSKFSIGKSYTKGTKNAPVTIYEFSDFQCPYCTKANTTIQEVVKKYDGKVQLVFKAFPLNFHKEAPAAHRAAIAAGKQGKFWEMHDLFFQNQRSLKGADMDTLVAGYAQQLGLNVEKFKKDYNDPATDAQVKAEMAEGTKVGVRGTPNFFVNGTRLVGAQGAPAFEAAIEAALKEAKKK